MRLTAAVLFFFLLQGCTAGLRSGTPANLDSVRSEQKDKKRAKLAMEYALAALDRATDAYFEGNPGRYENLLAEVRQAVDLTWESLVAMEKPAYKKPGPYKKAEIQTTELKNRLEDLRRAVGVDDRPPIDELYDYVDNVNRRLLMAVMSKPK